MRKKMLISKAAVREGDDLNTYLAIITTVLVISQIIRVAQNHIQLRRQKISFEHNLKSLADCEPTKEDFMYQRRANRLAVEYYEKMLDEMEEKECQE